MEKYLKSPSRKQALPEFKENWKGPSSHLVRFYSLLND